MNDFAELVAAIASLLWPIFAFVVLLVYKKQLRNLLDRLRRGKFLGQELELGASATEADVRPLASVAATESLNALLGSKEFQDKIRAIIDKTAGEAKGDAPAQVVETFKNAASEVVRKAFVQVDTRPLLGSRGDVWEEPYEPGLTVRRFLNRIWSRMTPYVRPYHYPDGWVLRDRASGRLFTDIGRNFAEMRGQAEDERALSDVGIQAGSFIDVDAGPKSDEALRSPHHSMLNAV